MRDTMAIIGMHTLLYSPEPEALRAVFSDVFGWSSLDEGWGVAVKMILPGDVRVLLYEPPHNTAI